MMTWERAVGALGIMVSMVLLNACSDPIPVACTDEALPSIRVQVVDSVSGSVIPEPLVWVRDGEFVDTLIVHEGVATGPFERPGTYDVYVEENQFEPWVMRGVQVTEGRCHVETRELTARLQPTD